MSKFEIFREQKAAQNKQKFVVNFFPKAAPYRIDIIYSAIW